MKSGTPRMLRNVFAKETRTIVIALGFLLGALLIPNLKIPRSTYTYIIFLDITQSMNVEDYALNGTPVSRLDYSRFAIRNALRELPCGSRIGLGAFAEYRTLLLLAPIEVCENYNDLLASLDHIDGRMRWINSSEIAKGVFWAVRGAKEVGEGVNVMFLTDGQEAPPPRSSALPNFDDVKSGQVHGWLIGVGGYAAQPIPKTDREGNRIGYWRAEDVIQRQSESEGGTTGESREHLSGLREPHLQRIAQRVGFEYAHLVSPSTISEALRDPRFAQVRPVPTDLYWLPAGAALLILAFRFRPDVDRLRNGRPLD
ncbi:MAG TPA: MxaL protein, partial [Burkholderiales bacterium]|nr:MxaL protein [Burkholderiales bacterium]